jgi:uncharacterized protein (DUF885 family)
MNFETLNGMYQTLCDMEAKLTPYSSKFEYQRYLESLQHYKKIMNSYITRINQELDTSIYKIVKISVIGNIKNIKATYHTFKFINSKYD